MSWIIRPLRTEDYAVLAICNQAAMPDTDDTAETLQDDDAHTTAFEHWVAEVDGRVVGSAAWFQLPSRFHPQKFWMDGAVHPDYQGRCIGSALYAQVMAAIAAKNPISVRTFSREDFIPGIAGRPRLGAAHSAPRRPLGGHEHAVEGGATATFCTPD